MEQIEKDSRDSSEREKLILRIKREYSVALFYFWPGLQAREPDLLAYSEKLGLSAEEATSLREGFFHSGLWEETPEIGVRTTSNALDLGEFTTIEYLTLSMNAIARMSEDGPCWYDALFVVTSEALKKEFYWEMNRVIRNFVEKSLQAKGETVVVWSHSTLDALKDLQLNSKNRKMKEKK